MPGGLESIALAVAHLEANSTAARFMKAPEERTSESRTKSNTTVPLPTSRSKLSNSPISSSSFSPPSDSLSAASATLKHRTLPGRMGLTQAGRVVSADHSDHRVESCEDITNEAQGAVRVTTFPNDLDGKVKVHHKVKHNYKNNKSKSQSTITTNTTMSIPSKSPGMKDSTTQDSSGRKSRACPTEEASQEDASTSSLSVDAIDSASAKQMEDMLFDLDLRELKTLTGPEPAEAIPFVQPNDVLCGRGGETNHHAGNIQYRQFVKACQRAYIAAKRRDKPFIAKRVVLAVRKLGGRFLKKDQATNSWRDVGNTKAREKTSQALREGAPELRNEEPITDAVVEHLPEFKVADKRKECNSTSAVERAALDICTNGDASSKLGVAESSKKKRRISLTDSAEIAVVPSSRMHRPASLCQPCVPSNYVMMMPAIPPPTRFATTVSADDEERSTSSYEDAKRESSTGSMKAKGPRIKLLKQRLETETAI